MVTMDLGHASLEAFAASEPTLDELKAIANKIALKYVVTHKLFQMRCKSQEQYDMQHKNALLVNKYFLLYEELSYSMNHGDIGHVETSIIAWIPILKAIGKHKYAMHMTSFLINMHFVFPAGLKHAVCYHVLVNPTGKVMRWQAVDWCVELNNLFTKMAAQSPHTVVLGRKMCCEIPDLIDKGRDMMEKVAHGEGNDEPNIEMDDREEGAEMEDILMEV
ncbi:hypothetical protein BDR04DRAFT_1122825 [Suillus decipiens]|nr:hypothetical protein BDR04DRAFT_1122825 [Suillus decipiens]